MRWLILALLALPAAPATATCPLQYAPGDPTGCLPVAADGTAAGVRCELQQTGENEYTLYGGPVVVPGATRTTYSCFAHELLIEETHDGPVAYMEPRTLTYVSSPMFICTQVYWTEADGREGGAVLGCYWS